MSDKEEVLEYVRKMDVVGKKMYEAYRGTIAAPEVYRSAAFAASQLLTMSAMISRLLADDVKESTMAAVAMNMRLGFIEQPGLEDVELTPYTGETK